MDRSIHGIGQENIKASNFEFEVAGFFNNFFPILRWNPKVGVKIQEDLYWIIKLIN